MDKPIKRHVSEPVYNWNACRDYIEKKYRISLRDYYGKFKTENLHDGANIEYYDFTHVISSDIHNGDFMWFDESYVKHAYIPNSNDEVYSELDKFLYNMFFDEFGDGDMGERICSFWVDW